MNLTLPRSLAVVFALLIGAPAVALEWPGKQEEELKRLSNGSSRERLEALRNLRELPASRLHPLLLTALEYNDIKVQEAAARMAADHKLLQAMPLLSAWLHHSDSRRRVLAADSLARMGVPGGIKPLLRAMVDPEQKVRLAVIHALGQLTDTGRPEVPGLIRALDDTVSTVRVAAVAALLGKKDSRAVVPLMSLMRDSSSDVRQAAARALGAMGDAGAGPVLVAALEDRSDSVVSAAMNALAALAYRPAVEPLIDLFNHGRTGHRDGAASTLSRLGGSQAMESLTRALSNVTLAAAAQKALVGAGQRAAGPVIRLLRDPGTPRQVALRALSVVREARLTAAVPVILAHLDRGRLSRVRLIKALGVLGDARSQRPLLSLLESPFVEVRRAALDALPPVADARAVHPLIVLLGDRDRQIKLGAVSLLGKLSSRAALPRLMRLAGSKDTNLVRAAAAALHLIADPAASSTLITLLDHTDQKVRRVAAEALVALRTATATAKATATGSDAAADLEGRLVGQCRAMVRTRHLGQCLQALGGVVRGTAGASETLTYLLQLLGSSDAEAFLGALNALAGLSRPDMAGLLMKRFPGLDRERKLQLIQVLGGASSPGGQVTGLLLKVLQDPTPALRAAAALTLGLRRAGAAREHLIRATRDPHWMVRINAAAALALVATSKDARLLTSLAASRIPAVRANALLGLGRVGGAGVDRILARSLARDRYPWARLNALRAMLKRGFKRATLAHGDQVYTGAAALTAAVSSHDMDPRVRAVVSALASKESPGQKSTPTEPGMPGARWIGLYLLDHIRKPLRGGAFLMVDGRGLVRLMHADSKGEAWVQGIPPGRCHVESPASPLLPLLMDSEN